MKLDLNIKKIINSSFEPGHTSLWVAKFGSKNNGNKLNLLGGYAPIQDYSFNYNIKSKQIDLGIVLPSIDIPYTLTNPSSIELTFYDSHQDEIIRFFVDNLYSIFSKNRAISLNNMLKHSYELKIDLFNKNKEVYKSLYLDIFPSKDIVKRGDNSNSLNNLPISFSILGYKEQEIK